MVTLTLLAFIGLVWLREQILHGGGPEWLDIDAGGINNDQQQHQHVQPPQHLQPQQPIDDDDDDPPGGLPDNLPVEPAAPEILDNANMGAAGLPIMSFFIMNNFDFHMNFTNFFLQLPTIKTTSLILVTMGSGIPWNGTELLKNLHGNVSLVLMDLWSFWSMCFG